jgi:hypothetical protein
MHDRPQRVRRPNPEYMGWDECARSSVAWICFDVKKLTKPNRARYIYSWDWIMGYGAAGVEV